MKQQLHNLENRVSYFSKRLRERIEEQTRRMNSQGIPNTKVTGLACRMAHEREQEAIAQWRQEQGITLTRRKATSKATVTKDGYTAGQRAGDAISLERRKRSLAQSSVFRPIYWGGVATEKFAIAFFRR